MKELDKVTILRLVGTARIGWFLVATAGQWLTKEEIDIADARKAANVVGEEVKTMLEKLAEKEKYA